jgi:DnaK suppressor protein
MAYIIFVQPAVLSACGMDFGAVLVATCLSRIQAEARQRPRPRGASADVRVRRALSGAVCAPEMTLTTEARRRRLRSASISAVFSAPPERQPALGPSCYDAMLCRSTLAGAGAGVSSAMEVQTYKEALLRKRSEILGTGGIKPLQASMENNTRQGDMADQASGNNEVHIQLKLKQTDAKILQAIEEALWRMEKGTYGVCRDCGEPIAAARLNAIPWTRVCIACKEKQSA